MPFEKVVKDNFKGRSTPIISILIGDGKINPIAGVYIPIIRIPVKGGMTIPNIATFDHGTYQICIHHLYW